MIEIKHRYTGRVLYTADAPTMREALEAAIRAGANLTDADLRGADLRGADLMGGVLVGANLSGANLAGAYLERADLAGASLKRANLAGAYLAGAYLERANLEYANLSDADLELANLSGASLKRANLSGASLSAAYLALTVEDAVIVETMPDHLRASHRAAGGWGVYPHNGAKRRIMSRADAEALLGDDPEYDHIVRSATPEDFEHYEIA